MKSILLAAFAALCLSACASNPDQTPKNSCLSKAAAAEIGVTQSLETTETLLKSGSITKAEAKSVLKYIETANTAIDSAGRLCEVDEKQALDYLIAAGTAMIKAQEILGE